MNLKYYKNNSEIYAYLKIDLLPLVKVLEKIFLKIPTAYYQYK